MLIGNQLGDGHGELRCNNVRFSLHMSSKNREYLNWLHKFYSERGYSSKNPIIYKKQIGKEGKLYYSGKQNIYTFYSLKWVYNLFYFNNIKRIPSNIHEFLTPQAQAIWFMDGGTYYQKGVLFSTYCFSLEDFNLLKSAQYINYQLKSIIYRRTNGYVQVLKRDQMGNFINIVSPYMVKSMQYKLGR